MGTEGVRRRRRAASGRVDPVKRKEVLKSRRRVRSLSVRALAVALSLSRARGTRVGQERAARFRANPVEKGELRGARPTLGCSGLSRCVLNLGPRRSRIHLIRVSASKVAECELEDQSKKQTKKKHHHDHKVHTL